MKREAGRLLLAGSVSTLPCQKADLRRSPSRNSEVDSQQAL